ncbi:hypothetical protein GCM10011504_46500 [Siccirubricoccus deserti]|uniref:Uncharacterized protein n=1 Tax=Siccirubricoccus deserti TaxID=2013562 RepID=A0A9X0R1S6_9PROT|nr:hypothetical protein [Siccirubricoccus deserti]MBC4018126.1 hypothetical protein [Siccirubricoccus deserti]GGC63000.1 hypothetical protein GCM10011504_46500 [Siccirubricoccus deserti]
MQGTSLYGSPNGLVLGWFFPVPPLLPTRFLVGTGPEGRRRDAQGQLLRHGCLSSCRWRDREETPESLAPDRWRFDGVLGLHQQPVQISDYHVQMMRGTLEN